MTSQQSKFNNFKVNIFVCEFQQDGSLFFKNHRSWDTTAIDGNRYYPSAADDIKVWPINVKYHHHQSPCSKDKYNEIARAQAELYKLIEDPILSQIYQIFQSVAEDMDYDFNRVGISAKFVSPKSLTGVCEDYANLLIQHLSRASLAKVSNIQKVHGQNHAWVTLNYGHRVLYLDPTWFDKNIIDNTGTVVNQPYKDPRHFTLDFEVFTNHGKHHIASK